MNDFDTLKEIVSLIRSEDFEAKNLGIQLFMTLDVDSNEMYKRFKNLFNESFRLCIQYQDVLKKLNDKSSPFMFGYYYDTYKVEETLFYSFTCLLNSIYLANEEKTVTRALSASRL